MTAGATRDYTPDEPHICEECAMVCDVVATDHGGYEEAWGRPVWVPAWEEVSACCGKEAIPLSDWIRYGWVDRLDEETRQELDV